MKIGKNGAKYVRYITDVKTVACNIVYVCEGKNLVKNEFLIRRVSFLAGKYYA